MGQAPGTDAGERAVLNKDAYQIVYAPKKSQARFNVNGATETRAVAFQATVRIGIE